MREFDIRIDDLSSPQTQQLLQLNLDGMHADSPAENVFALDLAGLTSPEVTVWSAWHTAEIAGMVALKRISNQNAELKSMRTALAFLRCGVAAMLLDHVIDAASHQGICRLSLETGIGPAFEPALALYYKRGFELGGAFSDYRQSEFNQFLHLQLKQSAPQTH